jgi:hypothetical protein
MKKSFHHEGHEEGLFTTKDMKKALHHEGHEEDAFPRGPGKATCQQAMSVARRLCRRRPQAALWPSTRAETKSIR